MFSAFTQFLVRFLLIHKVYVEENSIEANNWVKKNTRSLFDDWHSFGVYEKMAGSFFLSIICAYALLIVIVVLDYTKTSFLFGYAVGSASVINAMTNFYLKYPGIAWSATALTAIFAQVSPVVLTAVKYIVLGGIHYKI